MDEYMEIEKEESGKFEKLIGKILIRAQVHIVYPEINIIFLEFQDCTIKFTGLIGAEMVGYSYIENCKVEELKETQQIEDFKPFKDFIDCEIIQVRRIGEAWNGHGVEIGFKNIYDKTIIIQSIYSGDKPKGFDDCIRLGIGNYYYSSEQLK